MSSRYRMLLSRFSRNFQANLKALPSSARCIRNIRIPATVSGPATVAFSVFTWLGFTDKKTNMEDELIKTIKHCILFIQQTEYEKAEQLLHIALRQAQQINNQLGITYVYDVMANLALEREQLEKAKKLFVSVAQRIMSDGATDDDPRVVHISMKLARISHLQKEYTTAQLGYDWCLEKLRNAFSKEPSEATKKLIAMTEDWYGRLFVDTNQCENGLQLMIKSLERMKEVPDVEPEHIVVQLNDIGTVCDKLDRIDESISYFTKAIDMGKSLNMEDLGTMYVNLGRVYLKKNLIADARRNCGQAWKLGVINKDNNVKDEAESCLQQIKMASHINKS